MLESHSVPLIGLVADGERDVVHLAATTIARSLGDASRAEWGCDCTFVRDAGELRATRDDAIVVTSMARYLDRAEAWGTLESEVRAELAAACDRGGAVFVCTVFRHIDADEDRARAAALRVRIRRLNLLAAEISHDTGAYVVDVDRVLADIGGRRAGTDYRLRAGPGRELAAQTIALGVLGNALDAFADVELQDAAADIVRSRRPDVAHSANVPQLTLSRLQRMGHGGREQVIAPVAYAVPAHHAGWIVRNVLRGRIRPREALYRFVGSVRRRGVRGSASLLAQGLLRQIRAER